MKRTGKIGREAGGTFREPSLVSIVAACWTEKVESWARQQFSMIVQAKIGRTFRTIFTSSTSCVEQCSDLWTGLSATALLRNLRLFDGVSMGSVALVIDCCCSSLVIDCCSSSLVIAGGDGLVDMLAIALLEVLLMQEFSVEARRTLHMVVSGLPLGTLFL